MESLTMLYTISNGHRKPLSIKAEKNILFRGKQR